MADGPQTWLAAERPVNLQRDILFQSREGGLFPRLNFLARHVAASVQLPADSACTVFGISAPWGTGKSSALHVILDLMFEKLREDLPQLRRDELGTGFLLDDHYLVTTSTFRANLHMGSPTTARLSLAYAILKGFPSGYSERLLTSLNYPAQDRDLAAPIASEIFLRQHLNEFATSGPLVEDWILESFLRYLGDQRAGQDQGASGLGHVHVQFIDDLDRCSEQFTSEVLAALDFWSAMPNLFFVIAADEDHLRRSAIRATDADREPYTGAALEKFVHFQLHIPTLIESASQAAIFALGQFPRDVELTAGMKHLHSLLSGVDDTRPFGVMMPALTARTPRHAKRIFNELLQEFWDLKDLSGDSAKRNIARMIWPEAYETYVAPVLFSLGDASDAMTAPRSEWLRSMVRLAGQVLEGSSHDIHLARSRLQEAAVRAGFNIEGCPPDLLLYLGAEPALTLAPSDVFGGTGSLVRSGHGLAASPISADSFATSDDDESELYDTLTQAQMAEKEGDIQAVMTLAQRIVQLVAGGWGRPQHAPGIGNLALAIEEIQPQLAYALHQTARRLDPEHSNIRMNLTDFLLRHYSDEFDGLIEEHLEWLAEHDPTFKPERRKVLRAWLLERRKQPQDELDELVAAAMESIDTFSNRLTFLQILAGEGRYFDVERICERWMQKSQEGASEAQAGTILSYLAGLLMDAPDDDIARRGADAMRHVVAWGLHESTATAATSIGNYAVYMSNIDCLEMARLLYRVTYEIDPGGGFRGAYTRFLVNVLDDIEGARAVQQGQAVAIPMPTDEDWRAALAHDEVPDRSSGDGPHWWEEFRLQNPLAPIEALQI